MGTKHIDNLNAEDSLILNKVAPSGASIPNAVVDEVRLFVGTDLAIYSRDEDGVVTASDHVSRTAAAAAQATADDATTALGDKLDASALDTDGTMAANSDTRVASQKATRTYVASVLAGVAKNKGPLDCSANPNYPAALNGDYYRCSVAGKVGGASGVVVEVADLIMCVGDNAGGTQASVGTSWIVGQANITGITAAGLAMLQAADATAQAALLAAVTETLTNKRITPRIGSATSSTTPTINTDNVDRYDLTAQAADITSFTSNLSGTPTNGQALWISVKGTAARAITWGASFENGAAALPTTTVSTDRLDVLFVWNAVTSKWRCVLTTASSGGGGGDATKLPLAGGTMDEDAIVNLFNGSKWQQSTQDMGIAGDAGFSIICSAGYEYKFALGFLFVLSDNSTTVRKVLYAPATPTVTDDTTLGYTTDTTWEMADGTRYECTDVTEGAAVWAVVPTVSFATTATAAGTTTLTVTSATFQEFTGSTTQTLVMPDVTTLVLGWEVTIHNLSTGFVTVQANDASEIIQLGLNQRITISTNSIVTNTSASWSVDSFNLISGSGNSSSGSYCQISGYGNSGNTGSYCQISGRNNYSNTGSRCSISGYGNSGNSGSYCQISGHGNSSNSGNSCQISGYANTGNTGSWCQISGYGNNSNSGRYCQISGISNYSNSGNSCQISGQNNYSNSGTHCQISGQNNYSNSGTHSHISGYANSGNTGYYCQISGYANSGNTGYYCQISGQNNHSNSGSRSQISGQGNYSNSGRYCQISGYSNTGNTGYYCQISGYNNYNNSGSRCQISGQSNYSNTGDYCQISGYNANSNTLDYARVHGGGEFARIIDVVAKASTTDATPTTLTLGGAAEGATNRINIPANSTWSFVAIIVARETATANAKTWTRRGLIGNNAGAVTISALDTIGTDNVLGGGLTATIAITADNTNDALKIEGTGVAATNIKWTAQVNITQVG